MKKAQLKKTSIPFNCNVLGAKYGKPTELVLIQVIQKSTSTQQTGKIFLGQSFYDCPRKKDCGIYKQLSSGDWDYDWNSCPAKQKYP